MRALCGAIITAGGAIGLGLVALGIGTRYQTVGYYDTTGDIHWVHFRSLDTALIVSLVAALIVIVIGLGIAFLGLAYHHHRRHHEMLHAQASHRPPSDRVTV
jgi:hypothetical protein